MRKSLLYLHGLNSTLHDDRRKVLEKYDLEIHAPQVDYEGNPNVFQELLNNYSPNIIIGSSAGGLVGYYFSALKEIPALLFNPALPFRHYMPSIPTLPKRDAFLQIVIGARDKDVPPLKTFEFLTHELNENAPLEIHWRNNLAHKLPIDVFESELDYFLKNI